ILGVSAHASSCPSGSRAPARTRVPPRSMPTTARIWQLPFDGAGDEAADNIALEEQGKEQGRQRGEHTAGHHRRNVYSITAGELGNGDGNRLGLNRAGEDEGKKELVPGQEEGKDGGRDEAGGGDGQNDPEEGAQPGRAVDGGRIFQLAGHRLKKGGQHPDGKGQSEAEVGNDQGDA